MEFHTYITHLMPEDGLILTHARVVSRDFTNIVTNYSRLKTEVMAYIRRNMPYSTYAITAQDDISFIPGSGIVNTLWVAFADEYDATTFLLKFNKFERTKIWSTSLKFVFYIYHGA